MNIKIVLVSLFVGISLLSQAQIIDILQGHIGTAFFPEDENIDFQTGRPQNIYAGFAPAQIVGVGGSKFLTDKFQLNGHIEVMNTLKQYYQILSQKTTVNLKYNFIAPDIYRFSPYVLLGGNFNVLLLDQQGHSREYTPTAEYSGPRNPQVNSIQFREPNFRFLAPAFGVNGGLGLDVNVFEVISVFGEFSYTRVFTTRSNMDRQYNNFNLTKSKTDLTYLSFTAGIRLYMY